MDKIELMRRYGSMGARLYHLSRGEDDRHVSTDDHSKSISAETTFNTDISDCAELERILWPLAEKVSRRAKAEGVAGHTVVLKLKTADFKLRTRNVIACRIRHCWPTASMTRQSPCSSARRRARPSG